MALTSTEVLRGSTAVSLEIVYVSLITFLNHGDNSDTEIHSVSSVSLVSPWFNLCSMAEHFLAKI